MTGFPVQFGSPEDAPATDLALQIGNPDEDLALEAAREVIELEEREAAAQRRAATEIVRSTTPDQMATSVRLSRETGVPLEQVMAAPDRIRALLNEQEIDLFAEKFPALAETLQDVRIRTMAKDDLGNLITSEGMFDWIGRSWESARLSSRVGTIGRNALLEQRELTDLEQAIVARAQEVQQVSAERDTGIFASAINLVGSMADSVVAGAAGGAVGSVAGPAGSAIGAGVAAFSQSWRLEAGNLYVSLLQQGATPRDAAAIAMQAGTAIAAVDLVGLRVAAAPFRETAQALVSRLAARSGATTQVLGRAVRGYAAALATEPTTEAVQEVLGIVAENAGQRTVDPDAPFVFDSGRVGDAFFHTFKGMLVLGGAGAGTRVALDMRRAGNAEHNSRVMERLQGIENESRLRQLDPETRAEVVNDMAERAGADVIYLRGDKMAEALRQSDEGRTGPERSIDELEALIPGIGKQIADAEESGGDVVLPTGEALAKLGTHPDFAKIVAEHFVFDPDEMTPAEAREFDAGAAVEEARNEIAAQDAAERLWNEEASAVEEGIRQQLQATGTVRADQARAQAGFYRAFVENTAAELGVSPAQFQERFPLSVASGAQEPGAPLRSGDRGQFDPSRLSVLLTQNADASTFLHEAAHFFLHVYGQLAATGEASPQIAADMQTLLDSFGVADVEAWQGMTLEQQRPHHEAFALQFEERLFRGDAPAPGRLARIYERFANWLRAIYGNVDRLNQLYRDEFGEDLPILTGEVRQVMDRMMASAAQVEQAEAVRGLVALYREQQDSGMSDDEWAEYQRQQGEVRTAAVESLTRASLRDMRWLSNARSRVLKELQAKEKAQRSVVRGEVEQVVDAEPVYRARRWIRENQRLRTADIKAALPDANTSSIRHLMGKDGVSPDRVAAMFGYPSGQALVEDLIATPGRSEAISQRTDARMREEFSEISTSEGRDLAVELALHNEARSRFVATELKHAARATQTTREMVRIAKAAATEILRTTRVEDIQPRRFSIAEGRASREGARALAAGDLEGVATWKRRELLQGQLAKLAAEARLELDKTRKDFRRVFQSDERIAKTRDTNIVRAARSILALVGMGSADRSPLEHLRPVEENDPDTYRAVEPVVARFVEESSELPGEAATKWRSMTLQQFRTLRETVDTLWHRARRSRQVVLDGERMAIDKFEAEMVERLDAHLPDAPEVDTPKGVVQRAFERVTSWAANAARVERMFLTLDGGEPGPFTRLFRAVKNGGNNYRAALRKEAETYEQLLRNHDWGPGVQIDASEALGKVFRNKAELLGVMRHLGNPSNRKKALVPMGWAEIRDDGSLDDSRWRAFERDMIRRRVLTKADYDLLQAIWDLNESLKPQLWRAHFENFGYYPRAVEPEPFEVAFPDGGVARYAGGYVSARPSGQGDVRALEHEINDASKFGSAYAVVPRGMTRERNERYTAQLSFDLTDGVESLAATLRFVHLTGPVREVQRVLRRSPVAERLKRRNPAVFQQVLVPWLNRSALQQVSEPETNPGLSFVVSLARNTNQTIMFGNVGNSLQNFTGFLEALRRVPAKHVLSAIGTYISTRGRIAQDVRAMSTEMANRQGRQMVEVRNEVRRRNQDPNPGIVRKGLDWLRDNAYWMQQITQNVVDTSVWLAAYNAHKETATGSPEAIERAAIDAADFTVRDTQMATDPEDVSKWESERGFVRAMFPFQSWFIRWANANIGDWKDAQSAGGRAAVALYGLMLPMVMAQLISDGVNGRLADEDDDGWGDDLGAMAMRSMVGGVLAATPLFGRPLQAVTNTWLDDEVWNDRMPSPPWIEAFERARQALASGDYDDLRDVDDIVTFFGNVAGVPLGAIMDRIRVAYRLGTGEAELGGPLGPSADAVRALVTGRETRAR